MILSVLPIFAAAIISVMIGYVWFHPKLFGAVWMQHVHLTPDMVEEGKRHTFSYVIMGFLSSVMIAYAMRQFGAVWQIDDISGAIKLAFSAWLGFTAPVLLSTLLWEYRALDLYTITAFYWLVAFIAIAIILFY